MRARVLLLLLLFTLVLVAAMYIWFNHRAPVPRTPSVVQRTPAPVISPPKVETAEEPRHYWPKPVTAAVRRQVDDFIRRYKDTPPEELAQKEEFMGMMERFTQRMNTPEFERKVEERIEAIKAAKGGKHGTLNIATEKLDSPEGQSLLEAVFSEDTQRIEDFVMNKLDGAIFELAFDPTLEHTGNGVTVKPSDAPAPAGSKLPD
jgi:hypothetical protein